MSQTTVLRWLTPGARAFALAAGIVAAGLATVAGCGQAAQDRPGAGGTARPVSSGAGPPMTLCADPAAVSRVQITAVPTLAQLPAKGARKLIKITVTDPAKARTLARAVCDLPRMPAGTFHCPADFGGGYELVFTAAARRLPVVNVQASGCQMVRGAGRVRWTARTPGFWTVLGRVAGAGPIAHRP